MSKGAMKLALEALEDRQSDNPYPYSLESKAIKALREALAKPDFWEGYVPEPVKPAQQHQDWCASVTQMLASMPPRPAPCDCKLAQPYKGIADHINQATNGGMRIDPVTGNVGIGTPSTPAQQEPVAWMDRDGDLYANEPDKNWCPPHYPLYTTPPAAQPAPDLQAELEATNRQVEILSDALAESRREVAQLKSQPAPLQEPVVWMYVNKSTHETKFQKHMRDFVDHSLWSEVPLYGEPLANHELQCVCGAVWCGDEMVHLPYKHPQAQRKPLTDEEIWQLVDGTNGSVTAFARAIEAKLKEKNT